MATSGAGLTGPAGATAATEQWQLQLPETEPLSKAQQWLYGSYSTQASGDDAVKRPPLTADIVNVRLGVDAVCGAGGEG